MPSTTVTLTTAGTAYNLYELITGSKGSAGHTFPNAAPGCRELSLYYDPANTTAKIYQGDNKVTSTDFGWQITTSLPLVMRSDMNNIPLTEIALVSDTSGAKVDVNWSYA